jgi:hypothetical protein
MGLSYDDYRDGESEECRTKDKTWQQECKTAVGIYKKEATKMYLKIYIPDLTWNKNCI